MLISEQHPIYKLNQYKDYFSKVKDRLQSNGLCKEELEALYREIYLYLPRVGVKIDQSKKEGLEDISNNLVGVLEVQCRGNFYKFKFVVDLIRDVEIKILQKMQEIFLKRKDEVKLEIGSRLFARITDQEGYNEYKNLKSTLHTLEVEKRKIELEPKIEEWKIKLDQKFKESKHKQLDIIAKEINSKYISKLIGNNNQYNLKGHYITLEEVLNRANPTYEDKKILLKWDIYQVRTLLKDKTLTKVDKEALNEILKDLQKEKNKSKEDFDPQNDGYIQNLRETRDRHVEHLRKIVRAIPQSSMEETYVCSQGHQR